MHYYIDGYNLLFRLLGADDDFTKQRQQLIEDLNAQIQNLELDITIVFDSQFHESESTRSHFQNLEIIFTSIHETADDRILKEIKASRDPCKQTVVTSDKKLAWFARRCSAKTETVEQFSNWLNKRFKNKLRLQKEMLAAAKNPPKESEKKKNVPEPQPIKPPPPTVEPEKCTDYYLDQFQKKYDALFKEAPQPKKKLQKRHAASLKRSKKPPKHDEQKPVSDMDRWEHIFQNKLTDNRDNSKSNK